MTNLSMWHQPGTASIHTGGEYAYNVPVQPVPHEPDTQAVPADTALTAPCASELHVPEPGVVTGIMMIGGFGYMSERKREPLPLRDYVQLMVGIVAIIIGASMALGTLLYEHTGMLAPYWDWISLVMLIVGVFALALVNRNHIAWSAISGTVAVLAIGLVAGTYLCKWSYFYDTFDLVVLVPKALAVLAAGYVGTTLYDLQLQGWSYPLHMVSTFVRVTMYFGIGLYLISGTTPLLSQPVMLLLAVFVGAHVFTYANQARYVERTVGDLLVMSARIGITSFATWVALAAIY